MAVDIVKLDERIDRVAAGAVEVSDALGGLRFQNMTEVMEFAKLLAVAGNAVPKHMQGQPGMCLAVCVQALEWRMSPFAVANKSYEVQGRLCFESQLVHALIEQRAPIIGRLRHSFEGEGDQRICIVTAKLRETAEILEYKSPPFGKIQPKNSPLWKTKPDLQHYYNTSRDFCRVYFPDTLLGVYSVDELRDHVGPDNAKDVSEKPGVAARLKGRKGRGFNQDHVDRETSRGVIDESTNAQSSAPADGGAGLVARTASPNSPEAQLAPQPPQASPASGQEAEEAAQPDAGASQSPGVQIPAGEERQATESGASALHGSGGLPDGLRADWKTAYAAALGRAQKIGSLNKVAKDFWAPLGGYEKIKSTPHYAEAEAIYALFRDYFGDAHREKREAMLHEMGAL